MREECNYKVFATELKKILLNGADQLPKISFFFGKSEFLLFKATSSIKEMWKKNQLFNVFTVDGRGFDFEGLCKQRSLFDKETLYVVISTDKKDDLKKIFQTIASKPDFFGKICFSYLGGKIPVAVENDMKRINVKKICCVEPKAWELNDYLDDLLKENDLQLEKSAKELIVEACGYNTAIIDSEINRLALVFPQNEGREKNVFSRKDVANFLSILREDDVFQVDQSLLEAKINEANNIALNLFRRGESTIAILGMIARHCRISIKIIEMNKKRQNVYDIASKMTLPVSVIKSYQRYIEKKSPKEFIKTLQNIQRSDFSIKSSAISQELLLNDVFLGFTSHY